MVIWRSWKERRKDSLCIKLISLILIPLKLLFTVATACSTPLLRSPTTPLVFSLFPQINKFSCWIVKGLFSNEELNVLYWIGYAQEEMVEPAVNGTKNVITVAAEAKVRRVVFTSSIGTVYMNPNTSRDVVVDESFWSDLEYCKNTKVGIWIILFFVSYQFNDLNSMLYYMCPFRWN